MPSTNGHGTHETMERVALYLRVSSEEQKTKETIATQDAFLDEYCKLYHHEIAGVYKDAAISGTVPMAERPAGRELLEDAGEGKFDVVLVYSRLCASGSRNSKGTRRRRGKIAANWSNISSRGSPLAVPRTDGPKYKSPASSPRPRGLQTV